MDWVSMETERPNRCFFLSHGRLHCLTHATGTHLRGDLARCAALGVNGTVGEGGEGDQGEIAEVVAEEVVTREGDGSLESDGIEIESDDGIGHINHLDAIVSTGDVAVADSTVSHFT